METKGLAVIVTTVAMCMLTVQVAAQPTPFMIYGYVSYENGNPCDNPMVNITNLDTSTKWQAETNASYNYYHLILGNGTDINATEILRFDVTGGTSTIVTNHTISVSEVNDGGIFNFNITLGLLGDVNQDSEITPADAVMVLEMVVRGEYSEAADVSEDGRVTSLDALMILQAVANNVTL